MAIYQFSAKVIGRSGGRSAIASAAYRAGERLHNDKLDRDHDCTEKAGVVHREIMLPDGAPARWVGADRDGLAELKKQAAERWCAAVNASGEFGRWDIGRPFICRWLSFTGRAALCAGRDSARQHPGYGLRAAGLERLRVLGQLDRRAGDDPHRQGRAPAPREAWSTRARGH